MIKKENLYAETVITESPFFYDENGRLRVRVLEEGQLIPMLQPPKVKDDEESKLRAEFEKEDEGTMYNDRAYKNPADHPKEQKYQKWKEERKNKQQGGLTPMPEKKPEAIPEIPNQKPPAIRPGTGQPIRGGIGQRIRGGVARPGIGGPKQPGLIGPAVMVPDPRNPGNKISWHEAQRIKQGGGMKKEPARPGAGTDRALPMPSDERTPAVQPKRPVGKSLRSFRFSNQSRIGAGRNTNTRQGLRAVGPANRNMMEEGALPATEYLNIYEESMAKNDYFSPNSPEMKAAEEERKNKQKGGLTPMPEKKPEAIPEIPNQKPPAIRPGTGQPIRGGIDQRIITKKPLTPEERAAKKEKIQRARADWKAKNPEKAAELDKRSKERIQKRQVELQNLKKTDPEGYKARVDKAIEKMKARNPEKFAKREAKVAKFNAAREERREERKKFIAQRDDKKRADARERNKQIVFGNRNKKAEMPAAGDRLAKADRG